MKFLSVVTGMDWISLNSTASENAESQGEFGSPQEKLAQLFTEILLTENLIVFCGLGTSLCVKNSKGTFVAPKMYDLWDAVRTKFGSKFDKIKDMVKYKSPDEGDNIELLLSQCQLSETFQHEPDIAHFVTETEQLIVDKCRFVNNELDLSMHEAFLRKVARRSTRQPRMRLFTTNYDLCFEAAASSTRFVVVDGFSHTQPQEFDGSYFSYDFVRREQDRETPDYIPNVFHLYKIHGSLDWELRDGQINKTLEPIKPLIIYPRHTKFKSSYDQPFIEMMSRFQSALRQPNTGLLVIGCGFNDHHVSQPIMSAITSNVSLKVIMIDPEVENSKKPPVQNMISLIRNGDHRLTLLAAGFEEVVPILPDLVAATEEELHRKRLRRLGGIA